MIAWAAATSVVGSIVAGGIDARTGFIPDNVTRPACAIALVLAAAAGGLLDACAGALAVGGALLLLHLSTGGRGLGLGDVKLGVAIGSGLGPLVGLAAIGAAFIGGGAYALWLLSRRRARLHDRIPFGPFLAAGTIAGVVLFRGLGA